MSDLVAPIHLTPEATRIAELLSVTCAVKNTHFCIRQRDDNRVALCVYAWYNLTHDRTTTDISGYGECDGECGIQH